MASDRVTKAITARVNPSINFPTLSRGAQVKTGLSVLDSSHFPARLGELIEIVGASGTGKTQILHVIAANALQGANGARVCWFDLNGGLDMGRLQAMLNNGGGLEGILVYQAESTLALCASLHALSGFLESSEGRNVNTVIIDALGMYHYIDKFHSSKGAKGAETVYTGNDELALVNVLRHLLTYRRVTVYVSKTALYGEERLQVNWPFRDAGIPMIPQDFMPELWRAVLGRTILLYYTADEHGGERGVVAMAKTEGEVVVAAAGVIVIDAEGVKDVEGTVVVVEE